jgi:hypothetical protein
MSGWQGLGGGARTCSSSLAMWGTGADILAFSSSVLSLSFDSPRDTLPFSLLMAGLCGIKRGSEKHDYTSLNWLLNPIWIL